MIRCKCGRFMRRVNFAIRKECCEHYCLEHGFFAMCRCGRIIPLNITRTYKVNDMTYETDAYSPAPIICHIDDYRFVRCEGVIIL